MNCRICQRAKPGIKGGFFESSSENISGGVLDVLSPNEGTNRVVQEPTEDVSAVVVGGEPI